ncbi:palmitoyltransferase SidR [Rhodotorula toruloides]|uniref:Palmitoyltransferase n=1 Tax=Rhodotorula toruloides TaxID=5286 RepID=A0A511KN58_RHOTO|nr:palmitoyltransferase SidR [Rhodotorula toruloides]
MASPLSPQPKSTATTSLTSPSSSAPLTPPDSHATTSDASNLSAPTPAARPLPPLHVAAASNDLQSLYALLDSPSSSSSAVVTANDTDAEGTTPLHWAAINGHVIAAKVLLERGAEVDARGGELRGTPLMWAARNGHLPLVHLLLKHGADPSLTDDQSFNALHLSIHSSSAFLVAYLLLTMQPLAIDSTDPEGHTGLAWACYQGDAISVEVLLKAGADKDRKDRMGLTPLHWAVTKGNATCIRRLVEAGADLSQRDNEGKTPRELAIRLKSIAAYDRALIEAGLDPTTGNKLDRPLDERNTNRAIFAVVVLAMGTMFETLAVLPWYMSWFLVAAEAFGMHHLVARVLLGAGGRKGPKGHAHGASSSKLTKSPYLCAVIASSTIWVSYVWVTRYISLPDHAALNAVFGLSLGSCAWYFVRSIRTDAGTVRGPGLGEELKEVVEELVESNQFNGMHFCLSCLTRRPLRSKHSYATERYCPWIWNDVGVNNHRQFVLFVAFLVVGVSLFTRLTFGYFYEKAPDLHPDSYCPALVPSLVCMSLLFDPFALSVSAWAFLQLTWTIILLSAQVWQVARQMTTLEVANVARFGYLGGKPGVSAAAQQGAVEKWNAAKAARHAANLAGDAGDGGALDDPESLAHAPSTSPPPGQTTTRAKGTFAFCLKLLGLDRFVTPSSRTSQLGTLAHSPPTATNPFDLGPIANCLDFWTKGGELGVEYERLYGVPEGGFKERWRERRREGRAGLGGVRRGWMERRRAVRGEGYERVAMEDV